MKNLLLLFLFVSTICTAQIKDFFKYSTIYTSMSMGTSMVEKENYIAVDKGYEDITQVSPYDYNLTIGLRKIARMDYEYKVKTWYYGTERAVADNVTIGNAPGWEYLLIILLYGIAVMSLLSKISGLDILEKDSLQKHNTQTTKG